jgi:hypothetical protein
MGGLVDSAFRGRAPEKAGHIGENPGWLKTSRARVTACP